MLRSLLTIVYTIFFISNSISQQSLEEKLDDMYNHLSDDGMPGLSISIIRDGKILFSKGYGLSNIEHLIPFTPLTVSDLGSVSKQLTAFGAIMLHNRGKLSLDEDIRTYLKDLPDLGEVVTSRHLIHHTSGIPDVYALHGLKGMRSGDLILQEDALLLIKKRPKLDFIPGSQYRYSNTGYMLLAEIISSVTGSEFEEWMFHNIFNPLKMENTWIMDRQGEIFPNMADSYRSTKDGTFVKIYDNSTLQGGGGVYSTGEDMLKWIDNFRTRMLGTAETFSIFFDPAILNDGTKLEYAGGINVNSHYGMTRYTHNGSSAGCRTRMAYYPDQKMGFMVKSNTPAIGYGEFDEIEDIILQSLVGIEITDTVISSNDPSPPQEINQFSSDLALFTGTYYSEMLDASIYIQQSDTSLILSNYFHTMLEVKAIGEDSFNGNGSEVNFIRNADGAISSLILNTARASGITYQKK